MSSANIELSYLCRRRMLRSLLAKSRQLVADRGGDVGMRCRGTMLGSGSSSVVQDQRTISRAAYLPCGSEDGAGIGRLGPVAHIRRAVRKRRAGRTIRGYPDCYSVVFRGHISVRSPCCGKAQVTVQAQRAVDQGLSYTIRMRPSCVGRLSQQEHDQPQSYTPVLACEHCGPRKRGCNEHRKDMILDMGTPFDAT